LGTSNIYLQEEIHEKEFYSLLKSCHLQDHFKAVRDTDYLAKTTNYTYLVEKRLWQKTQLQRAVVKPPPSYRLHRTTDGPLNVTVRQAVSFYDYELFFL
jgi:hypothetical protein